MTMTTTNVKPPLLAYHGDPAIKEKYLARIEEHARLDQIIQGAVGQGGKGCAVWCTLEAYDHSRYPIELGVPVELARLEDRIFERLDVETSKGWPRRFLAAIRPGADLSQVWPRFALWACELLEKHEPCRAVAALYRRWLAGDKPDLSEWRAVRDAAYKRRNEAWRAAAVEEVAAAAVEEVEEAAAVAAVAAVAEAAAAATGYWNRYWTLRREARRAAWPKCADKLEELLREAPVRR